MHRGQLHAPFCHHPGGDRAVDAAGNQNRRFSSGAHRNSSGAPLGSAPDISAEIPDFHGYGDIRVMNIHGKMGEPL